ncbi:hypothetical protein [Hymenobacter fodinae]|uniref:Outer membrane protein with beta-barrel domain n=1 Tax=Hymenobacter fodinae TaxID=2510796 RepID=A0A4Z0PBF0_9BACT|nr:hypothetical protein [Hymenobacter fodinae]TGE09914.1 hypothetical protein EU556_03565 [Hymenobacter fodinae]
MKKVLLVNILLLISVIAQAQTFEPGYVVLSTGDTLRGEIQNDFWEEPPSEIRFRRGTEDLIYMAADLQSVCLSKSRLLRSALVPIDRFAQVRVDRLTRGTPKRQLLEVVLADVWVDGPASLLGITIDASKHFFVRREQQPYLEMAERLCLTERNGRQYIADANNYHAQLLQYFGDCPSAVKMAATASFTAKDLTRVVQTYNQECSAARHLGTEAITEQVPRPKAAMLVGLTAGLRYNSLRLSTSPMQQPTLGNDALKGLNDDGRSHLQLGTYLDLVLPGRRLALHTAVVGALYGRRGSITLPSQYALRTGVYDWRGLNAAFQFGLRGLLPVAPNLRVLVGFGYEINTFWRTKSYTNLNPTYYGQEFLYGFRGTALPYMEAGFRYKRYTFAGTVRTYETEYFTHRFKSSTGEDLAIDYIYTPISLSAGISYQLNRNTDKFPTSKQL